MAQANANGSYSRRWLNFHTPVTTFSRNNRWNLKYLSLQSYSMFEWYGKTFFSAEQAYQYARVQVCCVDKEAKEDLCTLLYNSADAEMYKDYVDSVLLNDLATSQEESEIRVNMWMRYRNDIMIAILMAKLKGNPWVIPTLRDTGSSVLANCSGDRYWGCGSTLESEVRSSYEGYKRSSEYRGIQNWIPMGNGMNQNQLGKIWMVIRDHLNGYTMLPRGIIVGDSTVKGLTSNLAKVYRWDDGKYGEGVLLASMLVTSETEFVVLHFGTFNIPKYHFSDPRYWSDRNLADGSIKVNDMRNIMFEFVRHIRQFEININSVSGTIRKNNGGHYIQLGVSQILPRFQDIVRSPWARLHRGPYPSVAQQMVQVVNNELLRTEEQFPDIQFIGHWNINNVRLFHVMGNCAYCRGKYPTAGDDIDMHYMLPLNELGMQMFRTNIEEYINHVEEADPLNQALYDLDLD